MTAVDLSVVVVHYRAADLAARAVGAVRAELETLGGSSEVLVVDNGSDEVERRTLVAVPARVLDPGGNLGYAGGVNYGIRHAAGRLLVVMNPDVVVLGGCLRRLVDELEAGVAAVGPRFFWDEGRRLLLPAPEARTRRDALLRALAPRSRRLARAARGRWRRHARRQWSAQRPVPTADLSGALLAIRRDAWERAGPFDEGYRLYFEETDWLHRLQGLGLGSRFVPAAEAVHLYDRSASREPRSREWFARSRDRFRRRRYGRGTAALLSGLERLPARSGGPGQPAPLPDSCLPRLEVALPEGPPGQLWVEVSPGPFGFPAAAERVAAVDGRLCWELPEEIWERLEESVYRLALVDAAGEERMVARFRPAAGEGPGGESGGSRS